MTAYYNENDKNAAGWLRELMKEGVIAPGEIDERDIREVRAEEVKGFTQCHFFAGIGVWSAALRGSGWGDTEPVWTGSCPCQPFSSAGKRMGTDDVRHLWPEWWRLIKECRPPVVFGEQVASGDGLAWLDIVQTDLEGAGYAVAPFDLCAAGFGAPHKRQRLFFVADARYGTESHRQQVGRKAGSLQGKMGKQRIRLDDSNGGGAGVMADSPRRGTRQLSKGQRTEGTGTPDTDGSRGAGGVDNSQDPDWRRAGRKTNGRGRTPEAGGPGVAGELGDAEHDGHHRPQRQPSEPGGNGTERRLPDRAGAVGGFWRGADWVLCRSRRHPGWEWRPIEPGTFPLVTRAPARVGRLRGYGNAINKEVTEAFIRAYREVAPRSAEADSG